MELPTSLFSSIRSAPFPKGSTLTPALPIGARAARSFISEYEMPNDFICVDEIDKKCQFKNSVGAIDTTERLYTTPKSLQIINDNPEIFSWNFKNGL
jgi:hypothetical protein